MKMETSLIVLCSWLSGIFWYLNILKKEIQDYVLKQEEEKPSKRLQFLTLSHVKKKKKKVLHMHWKIIHMCMGLSRSEADNTYDPSPVSLIHVS